MFFSARTQHDGDAWAKVAMVAVAVRLTDQCTSNSKHTQQLGNIDTSDTRRRGEEENQWRI